MNTASRLDRIAQLTAIAAIAAAAFSLQSAHAADKPVRIVELERVTVVAHRQPEKLASVRIVQLPRVVVVAHRIVPAQTLVAERASRQSGV
jgi:hypothetical protein